MENILCMCAVRILYIDKIKIQAIIISQDHQISPPAETYICCLTFTLFLN